jgi:hypothetical protein
MKKDHITQLSEALRNLEEQSSLLGFPDTASAAGNAAKKQEDYKSSLGQFILKFPPNYQGRE